MKKTVKNKLCSRCLESKPAKDFAKNTRNQSGLQSSCRACVALDRKKRYRSTTDLATVNQALTFANQDDRLRALVSWMLEQNVRTITIDPTTTFVTLTRYTIEQMSL